MPVRGEALQGVVDAGGAVVREVDRLHDRHSALAARAPSEPGPESELRGSSALSPTLRVLQRIVRASGPVECAIERFTVIAALSRALLLVDLLRSSSRLDTDPVAPPAPAPGQSRTRPG